MGVFPADQVIEKPREYVRLLRPAFRAASDGKIVVLGIQPRWAETGYGYIEFPEGVQAGRRRRWRSRVSARSPMRRRRRDFSRRAISIGTRGCFSGARRCCWMRCASFCRRPRRCLPVMPAFGNRKFAAGMAHAFPLCENISIDYAVLERAKNVVGIPAGDIGWNDVGSWNAVYELQKRDAQRQRLSGGCTDRIQHGKLRRRGRKKLVALLGVKDLIIVDTPDALLIADRSRAQQVGEIVKRLEKSGREDLL